MIKNERIYRYLYQRTKCKALSLAAAGIFDFCFFAALKITSVFSNSNKFEADKKWADSICPKPVCSAYFDALKNQNANVDISIIIPAYNAQHFIKPCVDSVLNQTTKYRIQTIVVNDNSTDNTLGEISAYNKIEIINFKKGGSAAKARNEGILHAVGKYIMFLDADDVLAENAVETLVSYAESNNADIVQGSWQYLYENGTLGAKQIYSDEAYIQKKRLSCYDLPGMPWGKVFRRELFENIRFPSDYTAFEDTVVHFGLFRAAKKICSVSSVVYYWRKNSSGITSTSQNTAKALQSYWIVEEMLKLNEVWLLNKNTEYYYCLISQLSNYCYVNVRKMGIKEQQAVFSLCCRLYQCNSAPKCILKTLPFYVKIGATALKKQKFKLWKLHGEISRYLK